MVVSNRIKLYCYSNNHLKLRGVMKVGFKYRDSEKLFDFDPSCSCYKKLIKFHYCNFNFNLTYNIKRIGKYLNKL